MTAFRKTYRLIIVRKNLVRRDGQGNLFPNYRYFFYLTNDRKATREEIVFSANDRCDQENLNAQLKGGVCALTTPVPIAHYFSTLREKRHMEKTS